MGPRHHRQCPTLAPCKALRANPRATAAAHPRTGSTAMARGLTSSVSKSTRRSEPSSRALSILSRPLSVQNMARRKWSTASPSGLMSPAGGMNVVSGWGHKAPGPVTVPRPASPTAKGCECGWRTSKQDSPRAMMGTDWHGPADVALGRCHWWWEHTWVDNGLRLSAWLQTRPAYGPAGHVSPIDGLLPAVIVDPHHDGALPGLGEGHRVRSYLDHGQEAQWAPVSHQPALGALCKMQQWGMTLKSLFPGKTQHRRVPTAHPWLNPAAEGFFWPAVAGTHPRPDGFETLWLKEKQLQQRSQPEEWPSGWGKGILGKGFQFPGVQRGSWPSFQRSSPSVWPGWRCAWPRSKRSPRKGKGKFCSRDVQLAAPGAWDRWLGTPVLLPFAGSPPLWPVPLQGTAGGRGESASPP